MAAPAAPPLSRPSSADGPPTASGDRGVGAVEARRHREAAQGWTVVATTVRSAAGPEAARRQADQEHNTPVAPGWRWSTHPAALRPGWLEPPARLAAWARLTVVGWRVDSVLQRPGRLDLHTPDPQLPGNTGMTAPPTAAVVVAWCAQVSMSQ